MQIIHALFKSGEGKKAISLLNLHGMNIEDYKLLSSETGDLLIINLSGKTDEIIDSLRSKFDFTNNRERSLIIFTPDTIIPRDEKKHLHATRESLISYAENNSLISIDYIIMLIISAIIISLGLILNNVAVIVGGMVIAPALGPILAIIIGIVTGNKIMIKQGFYSEFLAVILSITVGYIFARSIPDLTINESIKIRMFPTLADIIIALAAGAAASYTLMIGNLKTGLVGVMVAAALLPVMCNIGIGLALNNDTIIIGGFLLLAGNFLGLIFSGVIVFYFEGLKAEYWYRKKAKKYIKKSLIFIIISVILISIPLAILTLYQFYIEKPVDIIRKTINENLRNTWDYKIVNIEISGKLITVYIYAEKKIEEVYLIETKKDIIKKLASEYDLVFKIIPIHEIDL